MPGAVRAALGPNDKFDLLIRDANVWTRARTFRACATFGIRFGLIDTVAAGIPPERAQRVMDQGGKLVTPG